MSAVRENQIVFAISPPGPDGAPLLLFGLPTGAWDYMKDGKTHTFDFTKAGLRLKVVMFGGPDHAGVMKMIEGQIAGEGAAYVDERRADFAIGDAAPEELRRRADEITRETTRMLEVARRMRAAARDMERTKK